MKTVYATKDELFALLIGRESLNQFWRCQKNVILYIGFEEYCKFITEYKLYDLTETRLLPLQNSVYANAVKKGTLIRTFYYDVSELLYREIEIAHKCGKQPTNVVAYFGNEDDVININLNEVQALVGVLDSEKKYEKYKVAVPTSRITPYADLLRIATYSEKKKYQLQL